MSTYQKLQEIQKFHMIPQPKIPQKRLRITQEMMHKKKKKQLTQETKSKIYAQTLTLTTQTQTDIKKTFYETQRFQLNTIVSFVLLLLTFFDLLSTEVENLIFFSL